MKKMSLKIATESLSREEMRMITGGSGGGGCNYRYCHCTTGAGSWQGFYCSDQEAADAVAMYCAGGNGACTPN